jgi:hypothetical protein
VGIWVLPVDVFAVTDDLNINDALCVVNGINNPIVADAKTPHALCPMELPNPGGPRVCAEPFDGRDHSVAGFRGNSL